MDRSFNCLLVDVNANTRTFKSIPIYQNFIDKRKFVNLNNQITYLNRFTVSLLKDFICEGYDTKLWKVNCDGDYIEDKTITTDGDIFELGGKEMKLNEMFEVYFRDELNNPDFKASKIYIIAIIGLKQEGISVRYDRYDPVVFEREELEGKKIQYIHQLKGLITTKFTALSNYSNELISFRLDHTTSIDNLYNMGTLEIIVDKENDRPNKKLKIEKAKKAEKIWVRYDQSPVAFKREELENVFDLDDLKRHIKKSFNTLGGYSFDMFSLRKENETETLDPAISIDNLYNMTLEVIINKENDDESSPSGKSEEKGKDNTESEQVQKAFQTKYQGSVLETFYSRLKQFHESWMSDGKYAPYLAIIQSSGSGKTRLVAELRTKGTYVLYICKRSKKSSGYPKSTPRAHQVMDTIRDNKFETLLYNAIKEIKKKKWSAEEFWDIQIRDDSKCIEFWDTVFESLLVNNESSIDTEFVKKSFPGVDIPVVCCIDEAHELITQEKGNETYFVLWRRQIRNIFWKGFFNILLSTNGKIGNFLPPTIKDTSSARSYSFKIFPTYLDVNTTDVLASLAKGVIKDYDPDRTVYLGTPLWGSLAEAGVNLTKLILLASDKIRNFSDKKDDYLANLACMACALALEVSPRIAEVDNLIASHMATAIGVSPDRTSILCAYPSDAILASGALNGIVGVGWENCFNTLLELFSRGVIEAGERGELVNRILFSMRYVEVAKKTAESAESRVTYLEKVSLKSFLENMIGHDELLELLNHLEINEAEVGFNHWISLLATNMDHVESKGHKFLTKDLVKEAYHRHAAIKMPFGFEHIDHIIPFKYPSGYGVISIQNKNATFSTVDNFTLTNPVSVFGEPQEGYKILGIYTDFNNGGIYTEGENPKKATRSRPQEEKKTIIYIRGVEVFKFGDEINKCLSKILYTRPWPLDRCWSTFGEKELDRKNAIRSFLPIVFEQEKGQSLIEKWKMDDEE